MAKLTWRCRTWQIVELTRPNSLVSRLFNVAMLTLIFLNVVAVIAGSVAAIEARFGGILAVFEVVSVFIFSVEYLARLWSCTVDPRYSRPIIGRLRWALRPMSIIDLLAIVPFYLPFCGADLRSLRVLRLLRVIRIAKLGRYYSSLDLIKHVFQAKKEELVLTSVLMCLLLIVSASLLYYCENETQPEAFSSIPATMWWAVATLTTVGYGDMYPITLMGRLCASVIAILGIGMFALPTGILGAGFVEAVQKVKSPHPPETCPHCGKELT
ncbi:MAG: ion transporter [Patescibacteria group bacterium]|nr:ion transporter [Patescibacteria group bacterium]